jgi:hypothetical protein
MVWTSLSALFCTQTKAVMMSLGTEPHGTAIDYMALPWLHPCYMTHVCKESAVTSSLPLSASFIILSCCWFPWEVSVLSRICLVIGTLYCLWHLPLPYFPTKHQCENGRCINEELQFNFSFGCVAWGSYLSYLSQGTSCKMGIQTHL